VFGAAGDTANLGVSALLYSTVAAIAEREPDARITVFDNGWGVREGSIPAGDHDVAIRLCGARHSRRLHRPESFWNMRLAARVGGSWNAGTRFVAGADAVLDLSAGDSFGDLYGDRRFRAIVAPKQLALDLGRPLILLPQTYGPFVTDRTRATAKDLLIRASMSWARCEDSSRAMQEILGTSWDADRHRQGVDVAFGLSAREPALSLSERALRWLGERAAHPLIGFNVSGLVFNDPAAARTYGLSADYVQAVTLFMGRVLRETDTRVLFVPHVMGKPGEVESDPGACAELARRLGPSARERVEILPAHLDAQEIKWVISHVDWFCGTRMHSTIAALSSGVPTAAIAYSLKTRGVFATCGQERHVHDARSLRTEELVERLWSSLQSREDARSSLGARLPGVSRALRDSWDVILAACRPSRRGAVPRREELPAT
jgi:polysaccharide pyruvyl transferase WcaK-like protein